MSTRRLFGLSVKSMSMPDVTRLQRRRMPEAGSPQEEAETPDMEMVENPQPSPAMARRLSTGVPCMEEFDSAVNPEERQRNGQCPSCGQQLYMLTSGRRWFGKMKQSTRKKPLTIPGLVNRGQCLKCSKTAVEQPQGLSRGQLDEVPTAVCINARSSIGSDAYSGTTATNTSASSVCSASVTALYEGPHNAVGERHGKGIMRWANGDVYEGEFYRGSRQGTGTLNFADGSEYVGDWWNNYMHGQGTRRFVNGDVYVGDYRYNRREGSGRFYFSNGDLYFGNWKEDKMEGFGRYYYSSGQRFEGYFKAGRRNGKGKLQRTDGSLDLYRYEDDKRVGSGVRWSTDRTKAWRLDIVRSTVRAKKITVAEAVSLVYQIDGTEGTVPGEDATDDFGPMMALEDTVDSPIPGQSA